MAAVVGALQGCRPAGPPSLGAGAVPPRSRGGGGGAAGVFQEVPRSQPGPGSVPRGPVTGTPSWAARGDAVAVGWQAPRGCALFLEPWLRRAPPPWGEVGAVALLGVGASRKAAPRLWGRGRPRPVPQCWGPRSVSSKRVSCPSAGTSLPRLGPRPPLLQGRVAPVPPCERALAPRVTRLLPGGVWRLTPSPRGGRPPGTQLPLPLFQLTPHVLEEPVITKDMYEVAVALIQTFDDMDVRESG